MRLNHEIAEILGAFIGDGWIEGRQRALYIMGSPTEDKLYYDNYLAPLFSKYFGDVTPKTFSCWGVYGIVSYKKKIIQKALDLGFQAGTKALTAKIPEDVMRSHDPHMMVSVLRGIFDTDGSFWCERSRAKTSTAWKQTHNYHPEIGISSCSLKLLEQC